MEKLTASSVARLLKARKPGIVFDSEVRGFGLRITPAGTAAYIFDYRLLGRQRRYTIGQTDAWAVADARKEAQKLRQRVDTGDDPMEARESARAEPTVADLCD